MNNHVQLLKYKRFYYTVKASTIQPVLFVLIVLITNFHKFNTYFHTVILNGIHDKKYEWTGGWA